MTLRRWIDRALARWYVPRSHFDTLWNACELFSATAQPPQPTVTAAEIVELFIVTTDYQKGLPCS